MPLSRRPLRSQMNKSSPSHSQSVKRRYKAIEALEDSDDSIEVKIVF